MGLRPAGGSFPRGHELGAGPRDSIVRVSLRSSVSLALLHPSPLSLLRKILALLHNELRALSFILAYKILLEVAYKKITIPRVRLGRKKQSVKGRDGRFCIIDISTLFYPNVYLALGNVLSLPSAHPDNVLFLSS